MRISFRIILAVALVFLWAGTVSAADKAKKDEKPKEQKVVQTPKPQTPSVPDSQGSQVRPGQGRSKDRYNDFVDANNNGIDDRVEKVQTSKKPKEKENKPPQ
jgi:hypothetical protein